MSYFQLLHATQLTSRAALSQEDVLGGILSSHPEKKSNAEVQQLHDIVRRSLDNFEICPKQRKLDWNTPMEVDLDATDKAFRLVSWSLPPRRIQLIPDRHSSVCHQRPAEDTLDEAQRRQMQAHEAAVDADWIFAYSRMSTPKAISTIDILIPLVTGSNPLQLPSLLVTKPHRSVIHSASQDDGNNTEHSHVKCCPLVPLTYQTPNYTTKRKRKGHHHPMQDRPPPAFFRPLQEWGGKSAGYAMGWRGSRPANRHESRQYARDNMARGHWAV